jgi:hypothetical protein
MLAQSAYRSVDTMTKDLTDRNLVTKADAEHMYARFDRTLDTPPTAHDNPPKSIRSSHYPRRMSRRTPQHGHSTSHERYTRLSHDPLPGARFLESCGRSSMIEIA